MMGHLEQHYRSDCPICREEALARLNDAQERVNVEQELEPNKFANGLTWDEALGK